jgi:hypothetical protein
MSNNRCDNDSDYKFGNNTNSLQNIQQQINRVEDDSLESTFRALRTLNETQQIGNSTAQVCIELDL